MSMGSFYNNGDINSNPQPCWWWRPAKYIAIIAIIGAIVGIIIVFTIP